MLNACVLLQDTGHLTRHGVRAGASGMWCPARHGVRAAAAYAVMHAPFGTPCGRAFLSRMLEPRRTDARGRSRLHGMSAMHSQGCSNGDSTLRHIPSGGYLAAAREVSIVGDQDHQRASHAPNLQLVLLSHRRFVREYCAVGCSSACCASLVHTVTLYFGRPEFRPSGTSGTNGIWGQGLAAVAGAGARASRSPVRPASSGTSDAWGRAKKDLPAPGQQDLPRPPAPMHAGACRAESRYYGPQLLSACRCACGDRPPLGLQSDLRATGYVGR